MAKKSILALSISAAVLLFAGCPVESPSIIGTWRCAAVSADGLNMTNLVFTINSNATFALTYQTSAPNSQTGVMTPSGLPANQTITLTVATSSGPNVPAPGSSSGMRYSNLQASSVAIELDPMNNGWNGPFTFTK